MGAEPFGSYSTRDPRIHWFINCVSCHKLRRIYENMTFSHATNMPRTPKTPKIPKTPQRPLNRPALRGTSKGISSKSMFSNDIQPPETDSARLAGRQRSSTEKNRRCPALKEAAWVNVPWPRRVKTPGLPGKKKVPSPETLEVTWLRLKTCARCQNGTVVNAKDSKPG